MNEILKTVLVLLIASLIFYCIVEPEGFENIKSRVVDGISVFSLTNTSSNINNLVVVPSYQFCLEKEFNDITCSTACGINGMNYKKYKCINGEAICYCENNN